MSYTKAQQKKIEEITNSVIFGGGRLMEITNRKPTYGVGVRRPTWLKIKSEFKIIRSVGNDPDILIVSRIWGDA